MFSRPQEPSGTLRGSSGGPQEALRGPSGGPQIISTFNGDMEEEEGEEEEEEEDPRAVQDNKSIPNNSQ